MSRDVALPREPVVIGDPSRRISVRGAVVVIGLVVALLASVRFGFDWVVAQSDDWSLASARRVVATSTLPDETQAGLSSELDRLAAAFDAGTLDYDGLFATLQRLVEGPLVPVALLDRAAATPGVSAADAATLAGLARSLETQDFVPEHLEPVVDALLAGVAPTALGAVLAEARAAELVPVAAATGQPEPARAARAAPGDGATYDVVAVFRGLVDATLAGQPPYRYAPR